MTQGKVLSGWIDEVEDGIVWGRVFDGGKEFEFWTPVALLEEGQRVELEPRRYCSIVNGELLIDKTIWTTHDMEQADIAAKRLHEQLFGYGEQRKD